VKWRIAWTKSARNDLITAWLASPADRQAITAASRRIEEELQYDPDFKGEDFYGDRIFQYGPLACAYRLLPEQGKVRIKHVIRIREQH